MTELYLPFFQSIIAAFPNFNKFLQREEPLICSFYDHLPSNAIQELNDGKKSFTKLDISLECQKDDDLFIDWRLIYLFILQSSILVLYKMVTSGQRSFKELQIYRLQQKIRIQVWWCTVRRECISRTQISWIMFINLMSWIKLNNMFGS